MDNVMTLFYWGGNMVDDPEKGLSYDTHPMVMFNINTSMTLADLEAMLMHELTGFGKIAKLKLTCRLPVFQYKSFAKYARLPINNDRGLRNVIVACPNFPSPLEIYVEMEHVQRTRNPYVPGDESLLRLLTDDSLPFGHQPQYFSVGNTTDYNNSFKSKDYYRSSYGQHSRGGYGNQNFDLNSAGSSEVAETPYPVPSVTEEDGGAVSAMEEFVRYSRIIDSQGGDDWERGPVNYMEQSARHAQSSEEQRDDNGFCPNPNSDKDMDAILSERNRDTNDEEGGKELDGVDSTIRHGHGGSSDRRASGYNIPFYHNVDFKVNVPARVSDVLDHGLIWDPEIAELKKGMVFNDKDELKYAVKMYHVKKNREYVVNNSKKGLWVVRCKHDCSWRLHATTVKNHGYFQITKYEGPHHCINGRMKRDHCKLDSCFIAHAIKSKISETPDLALASIIEDVKATFQCTISYEKAWIVRTKAVEIIFGSWDESYKKLSTYLNALKNYNPGTLVFSQTLHTDNPSKKYLDYIFWAFRPSVEGFQFSPPVICIDSTHLYGKYKGNLLIATALTVTKKIYPLAFAIVDEESIRAWSWFLTILRKKIVPGRKDVTLISDRAISILGAVASVWEKPLDGQPPGHHRYCLRHVCSNFNIVFRNKKLQDLLYTAGSMHQVWKFNQKLEQIKELKPEALEWIYANLGDLQKWTLSHDQGKRWGIMTTNHSECFNSIFKGACNMPITTCVELTFYQLVEWFDRWRVQAQQDENNNLMFPIDVQTIIESYQRTANTHILRALDRTRGDYEVIAVTHGTQETNKQLVNLQRRTCTCGKYEIYRYPCSHMLAVTTEVGMEPWSLVADFYKLEVYKRVWESKFSPIPDEDDWPHYDSETWLGHPGRLRKARSDRSNMTRIHNKMDISRQHMLNHCSICNQTSHDKRICPERPRVGASRRR